MCMGDSKQLSGPRKLKGSPGQMIRQMVEAKGGGPSSPEPMDLPSLPPLPELPALPSASATQASTDVVTAIAGPSASTRAPSATQDKRKGRRRRTDGGVAGLSIGSTQSATGAGLNIGK